MVRTAVIVGTSLVNNYFKDGDKPFVYEFILNYLDAGVIVDKKCKYNGSLIYKMGNVVLYDDEDNSIKDVLCLSREQVVEVESISELYVRKLEMANVLLNVGDSKTDTATIKFEKLKGRVNASRMIEEYSAILNQLDVDIKNKSCKGNRPVK